MVALALRVPCCGWRAFVPPDAGSDLCCGGSAHWAVLQAATASIRALPIFSASSGESQTEVKTSRRVVPAPGGEKADDIVATGRFPCPWEVARQCRPVNVLVVYDSHDRVSSRYPVVVRAGVGATLPLGSPLGYPKICSSQLRLAQKRGPPAG